MKKQLPVLALGLLAFSAARPQSERWLRYMVKGEEFSVGLPKDGKNIAMWMQLEYNFNLY